MFQPSSGKSEMKPTLKTAWCSVSMVAVSAVAQNTTQIHVHPGFGNPFFDFTTFYEGQTPYHGMVEYIPGYQYNVDVFPTYGVSTTSLSYGIFSINDGYGGTFTIPVVSLGDKQCVAAVQLLTNARNTAKWRAFERVSANNMQTSVPLVMATFTIGNTNNLSSLRYGNNSGSHVGIAFSQDSQDVWILEQNWGGSGEDPVGRIAMRYMTYSSTDGNSNIHYANHYYVVHQTQ